MINAKLTQAKIDTPFTLPADIPQQPYFKGHNTGWSGIKNTEIILNNTFLIGVTPMINLMI